MQMIGINALIDIARYRDRWTDQRLVVCVLHNDDLNQVTWEQRVMSGDPKLEASQVLPDFHYAGYARAARPARRSASTGPRTSAPAWDEALAAGRPARARGRSPTRRCRRCRRTSASSRPRAWPRRSLAGDPAAPARWSRESLKGKLAEFVNAMTARRCADVRDAARSCAAARSRRPPRPARCRSALEIYLDHYGGSFGNKWMWTPVVLSPALAAAGIAGVRLRARGADVLPALSAAVLRSTALLGVYFHLRGVARKPGGFARGRPTTSSWARRCWRPGRWPWSAAIGLAAAVAAPGALMAARDFRDAGHLPKLRRRRAAADPAGLPRQRRGTHAADARPLPRLRRARRAPATGTRSRASVVLARVERRPAGALLRRRARRATLRAFCDVGARPGRRAADPGARAWSTPSSHDGRLDGYRYADMPDDRETWRLVARGLDEAARAHGADGFAAAPTSAQRDDRRRASPTASCAAALGRADRRRARGRW